MSILNRIWGANLLSPFIVKANSAQANKFAGTIAINSGTATVTVSTTSVKSDSIFQLSLQSLTDQSSGVGRGVEVRSIVDGGYFILGFADGKTQPRDVNVHWILINTK